MVFLQIAQAVLRCFQFLFRRGQFAVADLRDLRKVAGAFVLLFLGLQPLDLFLPAADFADGLLFRLPARLQRVRFFAQCAQFLFDLL